MTRTLERNFRFDAARERGEQHAVERVARTGRVDFDDGLRAHLHERTLERHRRPLLAELHACDPVALTEGSGGCRARHTRQDLGLSLVGQEHVRTGIRRLRQEPLGAERLDERP